MASTTLPMTIRLRARQRHGSLNPVFNNGPGGYEYSRVGERYKEYSPAHNVKAGAPPTILFVGDKDEIVPVNWICDFERNMHSVGAKADGYIFAGADHGFFHYAGRKNPHYFETLRLADEFLVSLGWLNGSVPRKVVSAGEASKVTPCPK